MMDRRLVLARSMALLATGTAFRNSASTSSIWVCRIRRLPSVMSDSRSSRTCPSSGHFPTDP
ncbi:hypothetical protein [Streptomyces sp. NPDC048643]|uniref:hypothetical protein n=1 Tax=Streptomyces sp. NPDC048643 TaxID=3155637 RepID=UPI00342D772B